MFNYKVFLAELIGTFALVFVGAAVGIYGQSVGLLGIALAHGLTLAAFMYVFGHVSGGHMNPAVTFGLALNGTVKWLEALVYWVAQFVGAVLAAYLLRTFVLILSESAFPSAATTGMLTDPANPFYYATALEAVLTFLLVTAFLHASTDGKAGPMAGWVVGTTLTVAMMMGGPLTGASLNPARSFGPALFTSVIDANKLDYLNPNFYLIYFVGPLFGSVVAVLLYQLFKYEPIVDDIMEDDEDGAPVEAAEVVAFVEEDAVKKPRKTTKRKSSKK
jgi:MIP family channel proteins